MKIENIELTKEELNQAVEDFLKWKNIKVNVISVESKGYPLKSWIVDLETKSKDVPVITTPEELGQAIVEGTV